MSPDIFYTASSNMCHGPLVRRSPFASLPQLFFLYPFYDHSHVPRFDKVHVAQVLSLALPKKVNTDLPFNGKPCDKPRSNVLVSSHLATYRNSWPSIFSPRTAPIFVSSHPTLGSLLNSIVLFTKSVYIQSPHSIVPWKLRNAFRRTSTKQ